MLDSILSKNLKKSNKTFYSRISFFGVDLKWFGNDIPKGYTSNYSHWKYINNIEIKNTSKYLDSLIDMRIPLTFSDDDCKQISEIIILLISRKNKIYL